MYIFVCICVLLYVYSLCRWENESFIEKTMNGRDGDITLYEFPCHVIKCHK